MSERFTIVFEGDIRKFSGNPLKTETQFGVPYTVAVGDINEQFNDLQDARAHAPTRPEPAWQPISIAPHDGSKILAFGIRDGEPMIKVARWRRPEDKEGYVGWGEFNMTFWPPTHWMPLPSPPSKGSPS